MNPMLALISLSNKGKFITHKNMTTNDDSNGDSDGDNQGESAIKIHTQDTLVKYEIITK